MNETGVATAAGPEVVLETVVYVGQLIEQAMEGTLALNQCVVEPGICPLVPACNVHAAWVHAQDIIRTHLQDITFDQLAGKKEECSWTH